jgi:hypothetical protein
MTIRTRDLAATIQQLFVSTGKVYLAVGAVIVDGWIEAALVDVSGGR